MTSHSATALTRRSHRPTALDPLPPVAFLVLAAVLPILTTDLLRTPSSSSVVLAVVITIYSGARFANSLRLAHPNVLDGIFWLFVYVFLGLAMLAQVTAGSWPLEGPTYSQGYITVALLLTLAGMFAYEVGRIATRRWPSRLTTDRRPLALSWTRAIILGCAGLFFVAEAISRIGISPFFESRDSLSLALTGSIPGSPDYATQVNNTSLLAIQWTLARVPVFIALYAIIYIRRNVPQRCGRLLPWAIPPLLLANLIVNNPISNPRFWSATVLVALAGLFFPLNRRSSYRPVILALLVVSLSGMGYLDSFRRSPSTPESRAFPTTGAFLASPDYSSSQQVINGVRYTTMNGHTVGKQLLSAGLIWVPRSYWSEKPIDTGDLVAPETPINLAAPLWTEGWVDFGLFGTTAFLFLFGAMTSILGRRFAHSCSIHTTFVAVVPVLAGFELFILRGSLQSAALNFFAIAGSVLFCSSRTSDRALPRQSHFHLRLPQSTV